MTWREFKAEVERQGMTEDTVLLYLDTHPQYDLPTVVFPGETHHEAWVE